MCVCVSVVVLVGPGETKRDRERDEGRCVYGNLACSEVQKFRANNAGEERERGEGF